MNDRVEVSLPIGARASLAPANLAHRRRTVSARLLASYLVVMIAFAATVGWSVQAQRAATRDAELLRAGYVPLLVKIGDAFADQKVFNAQLNHISAERLPRDVKDWLETARFARLRTFGQVRERAERGLSGVVDPDAQRLRDETIRDITGIERSLASDPERFSQLEQALAVGDRDGAERARDDLVKRGADAEQRLNAIRIRVDDRMESLKAAASRREQRSMQLLVGLGLLTLLVGVVTSLYMRRVLRPLAVVTDRANAVARGDLTPREVIASEDEIGELATTFESMVAAIQRARADLVQAERLATIGKMAAHITHEIRNPLSSIGLNLELLEEEVATGAGGEKEPAQLIAAIRSEVERLSRIAEQYLSVARRPRPRLERERVDQLVREVMAFVQPELERARVRARLEISADVPEVDIDEALIRQALVNLVRNAREAMPKGGDLVVSVVVARAGIDLLVDDTGSGIPEELRASIFDPFFTTKQRGTGLGLAVTREIIEAHAGRISCEPRSGGGTRFRISLPLASSAKSTGS